MESETSEETSTAISRNTDDEILSAIMKGETRAHLQRSDMQRLNLAGCADIESEHVEFCVEAGVFREIDLSHCYRVTNIPYAPDVTKLDLIDCCNITTDAFAALPEQCPQLTSLNVSRCPNITSGIVMTLAEAYPKLVSLNLAGCNDVDDYSIGRLAKNCKYLKNLVLAGCNKVTDRTLTYLATGCPVLASLDLSGCLQVIDDFMLRILNSVSSKNVLLSNGSL